MRDKIEVSDLVDCRTPTSRGDVYTRGIVVDIMEMDDGWPMYEVHSIDHGSGWFSGLELKLVLNKGEK